MEINVALQSGMNKVSFNNQLIILPSDSKVIFKSPFPIAYIVPFADKIGVGLIEFKLMNEFVLFDICHVAPKSKRAIISFSTII